MHNHWLTLLKRFLRFTLSGSDQSRSHSSPWSGTSVGRIIRRICSIDCRSGLKPPWQQKIFSSTIAATGRQLKQSVKVFHSLMLYLRLPKIHNYYYCFPSVCFCIVSTNLYLYTCIVFTFLYLVKFTYFRALLVYNNFTWNQQIQGILIFIYCCQLCG